MSITPISKSSQMKRSALKAGARIKKAAAKVEKQKAAQKERGKLSPRMKQDLIARDKNVCQLCLTPCTVEDPPRYDHVIPVAQGGRTTEENMATLHDSCNQAKGASKANVLTILKNIGHAILPDGPVVVNEPPPPKPADTPAKAAWRERKTREAAAVIAKGSKNKPKGVSP